MLGDGLIFKGNKVIIISKNIRGCINFVFCLNVICMLCLKIFWYSDIKSGILN